MEDLNDVIKAYFIERGIEVDEDEVEGLINHLDDCGFSVVDYLPKKE